MPGRPGDEYAGGRLPENDLQNMDPQRFGQRAAGLHHLNPRPGLIAQRPENSSYWYVGQRRRRWPVKAISTTSSIWPWFCRA